MTVTMATTVQSAFGGWRDVVDATSGDASMFFELSPTFGSDASSWGPML
jgi:hypothetical protein